MDNYKVDPSNYSKPWGYEQKVIKKSLSSTLRLDLNVRYQKIKLKGGPCMELFFNYPETKHESSL